jgi:hypothetical protein
MFCTAPPAWAGDELPQLEADALDGTHVTLPGAAGDKPFILVVAYDRSAKDATQQWAHELLKAVGARATIYAVIDAAGAPGFVHGLITSDVAKSAPAAQPQHRSNILITFDRAGWPGLAPAGDKHDPAIVVVDGSHHVVLAKREPFGNDALAEALKAI